MYGTAGQRPTTTATTDRTNNTTNDHSYNREAPTNNYCRSLSPITETREKFAKHPSEDGIELCVKKILPQHVEIRAHRLPNVSLRLIR